GRELSAGGRPGHAGAVATGRATDGAMTSGGPMTETVTVARQLYFAVSIDVPLEALYDFHWSTVSGGIGQQTKRPFLCARMSCKHIPVGAHFGHSCMHGPPPHEILVVIRKGGTGLRLYAKLAASAGTPR